MKPSLVTVAAATACKDVHIFLARGNNEPYPGRQGKLVTAICSGIDSCDYEDIQYNNPLEAPYCDSVAEGARNGIDQMRAYNKKCPEAKLVLSGYSQGAHVAGDILGGGSGTFFQGCVQKSNEPLGASSQAAKKLVAAMLFGDTRHTAGQSYNVLSGAGDNGLFPRDDAQLANLDDYVDVLHAYCVETDPICAGGEDVQTHLNYFDVFTDDAAAWVQEQVAKAGGDDETTTKTTTMSSTSSKTSVATSTTKVESSTKVTSTSVASSSEQQTSKTTSTKDASSTITEAPTGSVSETGETSTTAAAAAASTTTDSSACALKSQLGFVIAAVAAYIVL